MSCSRVFSCVFSLLLFLYDIPFYAAADTVLCFNVRNFKTNSIALENRLYQVNIFCHISARKHMLWVLIRSGSPRLLMSSHNICFRAEIRIYRVFVFCGMVKMRLLWSCGIPNL